MTGFPTGFPAQPRQSVLLTQLEALRGRADAARVEAVTGRPADTAQALGGRIGEALAITRGLANLDGYREAIALAEARATGSQAVLANLTALGDRLLSDTQVALSSGGRNGLETASAQARETLEAAVARLNTALGGRFLFAGDAGDAAPVADAQTMLAEVGALIAGPDPEAAFLAVKSAFDTPGGLFDTVLYAGGTGDAPESEIAEGERVAYQARADEPPLRDLLRNLAILGLAYDPASGFDETMARGLADRALGELRNTIDPLNRIAARIGTAEARIETVKARHVASEAALTIGYAGLTGADALSAATELQAIEGQLETLFLTTARLSSLSLASFLR